MIDKLVAYTVVAGRCAEQLWTYDNFSEVKRLWAQVWAEFQASLL